MLPSCSNVPTRTDVVRSPTEVFLERDCFCLIAAHVNDILNSTGKIKPKGNTRKISAGCMKNNTVSATMDDSTDSAGAPDSVRVVDAYDLAQTLEARDYTLPLRHNPVESPSPVERVKDEYRPEMVKCHDTFAEMPERVAQFDDEKLYVSAMDFTRHEVMAHKEKKLINNTDEAVEEMEEGSDDGSSFFPGDENIFCTKERGWRGKKTERPGTAQQNFKVTESALFSVDLVATATGQFEIKRKQQERLNQLTMKALHLGLLFYRFQFLPLPVMLAG